MLTQNLSALKLLLTDDLYRIKGKEPAILVAQEPEKTVSHSELQPPLFSGTLENGCLVLLDEKGFEQLNPETEVVLNKAFKARNGDFTKAGFINLANTPVSFDEIKELIKPTTILILGIDAQAIGFDNLAYNTPLIRDDIWILYTYKMPDILNNESRKKLFWEGFKLLL